jgi:hypothetical protein
MLEALSKPTVRTSVWVFAQTSVYCVLTSVVDSSLNAVHSALQLTNDAKCDSDAEI